MTVVPITSSTGEKGGKMGGFMNVAGELMTLFGLIKVLNTCKLTQCKRRF